VLHLDEVDALCETRTVGDLQGNCILSNMLVELERFVGILVMTTNRCGTIDPAIQSRMKLIVPFEALNIQQRVAVIQSRVKAIETKQANSKSKLTVDVDVKEIAQIELSGRDIQSAFFIGEIMAQASKTKTLNTKLMMEMITMQRHGQAIATATNGNPT
jgi:AAA+ superfamily predicted ATPase